jgi:hypothetical protein
MSKLHLSRTAFALAALAVLAACGGGEAPRSSAQTFTDALASTAAPARSDRLHALAAGVGGGSTAAAAGPITNAQLFQGAEAIFPSLFPTSSAPVTINDLAYQGRVFQVRAYANGNFLGISNDGVVWGLGPYTGGALVQFGAVQGFADLVCANINCGGTGGNNGGGGSLNGCTEGASVALRTGTRYTANYLSSVLVAPTSTGEFQIEGEVEGSATFEGQSAVKSRSRVRGTQFGTSVDTNVLSYQQAAENDLIRSIGAESSGVFSGFQATTKIVYNPASLNSEFTLSPGGSLTKTETMTSTISATGVPFPLPPTTTSTTTTYTYEARETISVLGRSWDTCRYKMTTQGAPGATYTWHILGKGFAAKIEQRNDAGTPEYRSELRSATINGAPL